MSLNIRTGIGERGPRLIQYLLAGRENMQEGLHVIGRVKLDFPSLRVYEATFSVTAQVSNFGIAGKAQLVDVTNGDALIHEFNISDDEPTQYEAIVFLDRGQVQEFELRAGLNTGGGYGISDFLQIMTAAINIRSTF